MVQVLIDLQILTKEIVINGDSVKLIIWNVFVRLIFQRLKFILGTLQEYGKKQGLKEAFTYYKKWGSKGKDTVKLCFSKSGNEYIKKRYATQFIKSKDGILVTSDTVE